MSGALAEIDRLSADMDKYPATTIARQDWGSNLREARAAVAELVAAASHAAEWIDEAHVRYRIPNAVTFERLKTALARCGGAK